MNTINQKTNMEHKKPSKDPKAKGLKRHLIPRSVRTSKFLIVCEMLIRWEQYECLEGWQPRLEDSSPKIQIHFGVEVSFSNKILLEKNCSTSYLVLIRPNMTWHPLSVFLFLDPFLYFFLHISTVGRLGWEKVSGSKSLSEVPRI